MTQILKLTNGELIVTHIASEDEHVIVASDPMYIVNTEHGMMLESASLFSQDKTINIPTNAVLWRSDASEPVQQYYNTYARYFAEYTGPLLEEQMIEATEELTDKLESRDDNRYSKLMADLVATGKITKH